ncbi:MAG: hypothetical protein JWN41_675 [Thermoleophilia bacterium]|nr:hypothetical protein [Thermoleophilia bacterium]
MSDRDLHVRATRPRAHGQRLSTGCVGAPVVPLASSECEQPAPALHAGRRIGHPQGIVLGGGALTGRPHIPISRDPTLAQAQLTALLQTGEASAQLPTGVRTALLRTLQTLLDVVRSWDVAQLASPDAVDRAPEPSAAMLLTVDDQGVIVLIDAAELMLPPALQPSSPENEVWSLPTFARGDSDANEAAPREDAAIDDALPGAALAAWVSGVPRGVAERAGAGRRRIRNVFRWGADYRLTSRGLAALMLIVPAVAAFALVVVDHLLRGH